MLVLRTRYLGWIENLGPDALMGCKDDDWSGCKQSNSGFGVVLRDRLMTDAALGGPKPIKSEHSYSMLASITDMEEECFPAISMTTASGRDSSRDSPEPHFSCGTPSDCGSDLVSNGTLHRHELVDPDEDESEDCPMIKGEPLSEPGSPCNSEHAILIDDKGTMAISPHSLHITRFTSQTSDDSEDDDDVDMQREFKVESLELCEGEGEPEEDCSVVEEASSGELPPTPPSSASSDSEGTVSASCSPERRDSHGSSAHVQNLRGFLQPRLYVTANGAIGQHAPSTRQPIHTPLISCQPKGSTGVLVLTEEEKRTLVAEGYPVPTKLPLTKQEEKSLKKVRRKIKNKISAQESRRKKKEYMDGLERRVTLLTNENTSYREKVTNLENSNRQLLKELQRLQALIQRKSS
ncbi:hypothetical protein QAD02_011751 [Eretmocerus hayati]|uniref:Uncharacterized protein n=1 Tax=Eretmocerus hayati TaxID=131215 RepID=A0ACC2NXP2_9HYME|nr:hypothetical protein QAD02_011751 [Eretmocerus hayati]